MMLDGKNGSPPRGALDWVNTLDVPAFRRAVVLGCALFWIAVILAFLA